jgi:ParB-like nuclease domain
MEVATVPIAAIHVGTRKRPVDTTIVREIAQSIELQGLLQPIGVKPGSANDGGTAESYDLVFGAHRLEAYILLQRADIEALLLPDDLTPEEYLLIELEENSARNDLSKAQRKAYASDVGQIMEKMATDGKRENFQKNWLVELSKKIGVVQRSLLNWWHDFCAETKRTITPRQALGHDREAFFAWLHAKQEHEAAEKQRKEEEALAARRRQDLDDALENLETLATDYGRETVIAEVIEVFLHAEEDA